MARPNLASALHVSLFRFVAPAPPPPHTASQMMKRLKPSWLPPLLGKHVFNLLKVPHRDVRASPFRHSLCLPLKQRACLEKMCPGPISVPHVVSLSLSPPLLWIPLKRWSESWSLFLFVSCVEPGSTPGKVQTMRRGPQWGFLCLVLCAGKTVGVEGERAGSGQGDDARS